MRLTKAFKGCRTGEIYPTQFQPGDTCPPELEHAAKHLKILESEAEFQKRLKVEQRQVEAEEADRRIAQLRALAEQHNVDLGDAKTEAQLVAALQKAGVEIPVA